MNRWRTFVKYAVKGFHRQRGTLTEVFLILTEVFPVLFPQL